MSTDQQPKSAQDSGNGQTHRCRIVLVEDQADSRKMLARWLELKGHRVQSAADGLAGVALIEREQPEIALVDIGLPKIDGYEVARRIRGGKSWPAIKLVALTGYVQPADAEAARQAGLDYHIVKHVDPAHLDHFLPSDD